MPLRWVPPALFVEYKGKKVFHAYKDDNENDQLWYWFTTDEREEPHYEFDVRFLQYKHKILPDLDLDLSQLELHRKVIVAAIDAGVLEFPEEDE